MCFLSTTFPNAPAHPPILFDQFLTQQMEDVNYSVSAVCSSVEWLFSDVINHFKFLDFKENVKIGLSSVGKMYVVSALLRNAITCLYRNTTSSFFSQPSKYLGLFLLNYHLLTKCVN